MENEIKIPIEVSARHIHLTQEHVEILFGEGYQLTHKKELSQPGYFVTQETVEVIGSKSSANFSILTPLRKQTQIEVAITDAVKLGIPIFLRDSGDLAGTGSCTIKGPKGQIELEEGVIVARRHIHCNDEYAAKLNVKDKDFIDVVVDTDRPLVFKKVLVRTDPSFGLTMHIDTDEGNAANINNKNQTFGRKI